MSDKNIVLGILAHVDAGKTTLSEDILYLTGVIRKLGRVDHKTAFLDSSPIEQNRGITVFSKEARFTLGDKKVVLLDTPGHADFSSEAERTLQVLDYAVLLISGPDGVQGHTTTLWKLLEAYKIPTFVFVNKMDRPGTDRSAIMNQLNQKMGSGFVEFKGVGPVSDEEAAMCGEKLMEEYLEKETVSCQGITEAIKKRQMFPVCFGSALKVEGVEELLATIQDYAKLPEYGEEFAAKVYKITRDKQGVRQTHMKITGGSLKSKTLLSGDNWEEKAEQLRLFSGKTFEMTTEVSAGDICAVVGLSQSYAGEALGEENSRGEIQPLIEPALTYRLILPQGADPAVAMPKLKQLSEEDPSLNIVWKESLQEIQVQVMGKLELEILHSLIKERFDMEVTFGQGSVIYKETIAKPVIGIGHFEPLRHYAEVQLLMEPLPRGAGLVLDNAVSEDKLDKNWQRLIMTHLQEREHPGVLIGTPITDIKITLIAGRAHQKHTEGGDFRQATYRAIRQGLRKAESLLLEPVYSFVLELPTENAGRGLSDIQRFGGACGLPCNINEETVLIEGTAPVAALQDYQQEVAAYTKGRGRFTTAFAGYDASHNQEAVIAASGYSAESDLENPTGSVFCSHGSAEYVSWDMVDQMAHVDSGYRLSEDGRPEKSAEEIAAGGSRSSSYQSVGAKELEEIFLRTYGKSKRDEALRREQRSRGTRGAVPAETGDFTSYKRAKTEKTKPRPYYIIDGYNVLFAWEELKELAQVNIDSAREAFLEALENYRAYKDIGMVVVFDGYKVSGNPGAKFNYGELQVVYTKEAETADRFIEKTAYEMGRTGDIMVVTSDLPVQMAALGDGASRLSSREFCAELTLTSEEIRQKLSHQKKSPNRPFEGGIFK